MGKRPRLYTEFKSIHRWEGIHELARITFLAYQTGIHFVGLSNKYPMLAKFFKFLFIPGVAKTFLCKYELLSLSDLECYVEKGCGPVFRFRASVVDQLCTSLPTLLPPCPQLAAVSAAPRETNSALSFENHRNAFHVSSGNTTFWKSILSKQLQIQCSMSCHFFTSLSFLNCHYKLVRKPEL